MSIHTIPTRSQAGDFISERCARRISAHRRTAKTTDPALLAAGDGSPATTIDPITPTENAASGARILRRWSVAELIYSAAARPPVVA